MRLRGKVAIITGAGSGQGAAEARLFAREGAWVVVTDLDRKHGQEVASSIGDAATFIDLDVTDEGQWSEVVASTLKLYGTIDILVNNAGIYKQRTFQETDVALLDLHYGVNVLGTYLGMAAVYPTMAKNHGGAIVNVSSGVGLKGYPGVFAYASSKWMVRGMSKCAAIDLAPENIRVNTIIPGLIDTPMLADNTPEYLEAIKRLAPAGRLGTADEIAAAALYLASDEASYVFGAEIAVCGGLAA